VTRALGASTFAFAWKETALDALRRLRGLGLDGFDVVLAPGHCWPAELSPAERSRLASTGPIPSGLAFTTSTKPAASAAAT
jgi:hypothetical protein